MDEPVDNWEDDMHTDTNHRTRVRFIAAEIRGGRLERSGDPDPNLWGEHGYAIRQDDQPGPRSLRSPVWVLLELTPAERRQWATMLLDGLEP